MRTIRIHDIIARAAPVENPRDLRAILGITAANLVVAALMFAVRFI